MSSSEEDEYQEPINFVQIEHAIRETSNRIARGVRICSERYQAFQTAERAYDAAYARAYLNADGPAHERKYRAELATQSEREARDVAEASHKYSERQSKALESQLRALQSLGAGLRQQFAVAGIGEGA
ncbi:hypothetical protein K8O93_00870 [Gordonia bronchialis]|uniref:hypothetical protein n=1 Tax=Gordonia bronchialis TaxID=2054 RepID=UPI001CBC59DE|nr:hypothetical protein [Gordonia bronchialis]UAK38385.1 hypothetical protein K8O93_00870 [Gordonia bronchialis]